MGNHPQKNKESPDSWDSAAKKLNNTKKLRKNSKKVLDRMGVRVVI